MQFKKTFHLFFISLSLLLVHFIAEAREVCASCPISTIKEGIAASKSGDTLWIRKGTYKEYNIFVDKALTIIGEDFPIIDGENKGEIIRIVADSVSIDGLFIKNVGSSYTTDFAAIRVVRSQHFTIRNVTLEKLFFGIFLEKSNNGKIYHNTIIGEAV